MKKSIYIVLCILNMLLVIDVYVFGILKEMIKLAFPKNIFQFWFNSYYMRGYSNENIFYFFYVDIIVKLVVLILLLILIIRNKDAVFNWILLKTSLVIFGVSFIYIYIFYDLVSFQFSSFVKFIFIGITILFLHNYFKKDLRKPVSLLYSKKLCLLIIAIVLLPIFIVKLLNFSDDNRNNKKSIVSVINYLVLSKMNATSKEIILNKDILINIRSDFYTNAGKQNIPLFDKIYMYSQFCADKVTQWNNDDFTNVRVISTNEESENVHHKLDSLNRICGSSYEYFISRPIFNHNGDIAYVSVSSIFIPEPTGRYAEYEDVFLEKKNNEWTIKKQITDSL